MIAARVFVHAIFPWCFEHSASEEISKLNDVLQADEAFITGTFANIIPIKKINNKKFQVKKTNQEMPYLPRIHNKKLILKFTFLIYD